MTTETRAVDQSPNTYFASAERADEAALRVARAAFLADSLAMTLLEAMPDFAVVLNQQRQIIAANSKIVQAIGLESDEALVGKRPGEVIHCTNVEGAPDGCGTGENCASCGAINAVLDALGTHETVTREARMVTLGGALDFQVKATFFTLNDGEYVVAVMRDISAEKRREVLERVFFHDVLNTIGGIYGLAEYLQEEGLDPEVERECKRNVHRLSKLVIEEIISHRQLLAAERGNLHVTCSDVHIPTLLYELTALYRHHRVGEARTLQLGEVPDITLTTDDQLLRRVLANLVKNALEAVPKCSTVTVTAEDRGDAMAFLVHNPGVIPDEVRAHIFQRSFSTKGGRGRGIGTYSIKLFTEQFLRGHVSFTSTKEGGTTFTVMLPKGHCQD